MNMAETDTYITNVAQDIARKAIALYEADLHTRLYLYHRPTNSLADGQVGAFADLPGKPWELSHPVCVPRFQDRPALVQWVRAILVRLPILPHRAIADFQGKRFVEGCGACGANQ